MTCRTYPAAAPGSGPSLPDEATTGYTMWLHPRTVVETSGAATRTTTTEYDTAERAISVQDDHGRADRVYGAPWVVYEVPHRQWARGLPGVS